MMSQKGSRREKESLMEFESQTRDLRQQLGEQLRCLETKVETENAILSELQEFVRRRAEIETSYGKQLERLCRQMLTQHKADRAKRENWRNYSTFRCWQTAVLNARSVSQDHILLGEMLGSHVSTRLGELIDDSQRLFRKCKTMHVEYQEDLFKSLIELQTSMKAYHTAFGEFAAAQQKLAVLDSQREKLQAQLVLKQKRSGKEKEKEKDREGDKSANKHGSGERLSTVGVFKRQDSEPPCDSMNASLSVSHIGGESHSLTTPLGGGSQRDSQLAGASSTSGLFSLSFVCGSAVGGGSQDSPVAGALASKNSSSASASNSPRDSALHLAANNTTGSSGGGGGSLLQTTGSTDAANLLSAAASSSLKAFSSSSTLTKKLKSIERQCEKKRAKYSECRAKALRSRNDYLLTLESCNASMSRLFTDDIPDLIDCMNCGYHTSLCNSMLMQLYAEAALAQTHQNNVETVGRCCSHLDARDDKQRFLKERTNYAAFNASRRWPFQAARGDPNASLFVAPPINSVLQDELLARCAALRARLDQLRVEADNHCKSLREFGTRLLERLATPDYDVAIRFDSEHRREALVASPLRFGDAAPTKSATAGESQHRASTDSQSRPSNAGDEEQEVAAAVAAAASSVQQASDAFNVEKRRETRSERVELEAAFLAAFRKYVATNQQAARVHSQLEAVQRSLLDNADYVRLAHSLARAQANASQRCSTAPNQPSTPSASSTKLHTDVLIRLVRAPIEKPRRRRLLKAPTLVRPRLFGGFLDDYVLAHDGEIPTVVISCVRVLARFGLRQQGLFRISGATTDINEMRGAYERGEDPLEEWLSQIDTSGAARLSRLGADAEHDADSTGDRQLIAPQKINAVASLLKLYFRELAEPLFPTELFDDFVSAIYCLQLRDFQLHPVDALHAFIARLRELVATLSRPVRATMRYLFAFLKHVSELCDENMMDPANLAICFGPTLMPIPDQDPQVRLQTHVNDLVKAFIVYAADIFDDPNLPGPIYDRNISAARPGPEPESAVQPVSPPPNGTVVSNTLTTSITGRSYVDSSVDGTLRSPVGTMNGTLSRSTRNLAGSTLTLTRVGTAAAGTMRQSAVVVVQVHATAERDGRPATGPQLVDASTQTCAAAISHSDRDRDRDLGLEPLSSDLGASLSSTSSQARLVSSASMLNDANCSSRSPSSRTNDEQASPKSSLDDETNDYDMGTLRHESARPGSDVDVESKRAVITDLTDCIGHEQTSELAPSGFVPQKSATQSTEKLLYAASSSVNQPTFAVAHSLVQDAREPAAFANSCTVLETDIVDVVVGSSSLGGSKVTTLGDAGIDTRSRASLPSIAESAAETHLESLVGEHLKTNAAFEAGARRLGGSDRELGRCGQPVERDTRSMSGTDEETDTSYDDEERLAFDDDLDAQISEAVATCDYEAGTEQEVSFRRGDTILLFARVSEDWWTGVANGQEGLIPHRYIAISRTQRPVRTPSNAVTQASSCDHLGAAAATSDMLPPPAEDSLETYGNMDDDRQIDEALEQAMNGIESLDAVEALSGIIGIAAKPLVTDVTSGNSSKDGSPDSDGFPLPPAPEAPAGYDELLDDFVADSQASLPLPYDAADEDNDEELIEAATRQQAAIDLLDEIAARFEEMRATPTNADMEDGNSSAHSTLSRDGDSAQPRSLAEVFAKTDHPTMRKGTSLASNSSLSVDNALASMSVGIQSGAASHRLIDSLKDPAETASISSVHSAPSRASFGAVKQEGLHGQDSECEGAKVLTAVPVFVSRASGSSSTQLDLRKSASPDLPSIDQFVTCAIDVTDATRSLNQSKSSLLFDDPNSASKRSSVVSVSDSSSNLTDSSLALTGGLRKPPPTVLPKPRPPQRTSSLFPAPANASSGIGSETSASETGRSDEAARLSVSAKRAMFETPHAATD